MEKNYYDVLGVPKNASQDDIKKAFRTLSKKYHPDKNNGDDTKFKEINEAYTTLGDESKRREYDMTQNGFGGFNPFGGFGFEFGGPVASDIQVTFTISLDDAYYGCKKIVNVNGRVLSVDIPQGTPNGKIIKIPGMGQSGRDIYGRTSVGDLIVRVGVANEEKIWVNDNGLLEIMYVVDWIDAILGGYGETTVFDRKVKIRIPKYTQNGGWTMVAGQGFRKFKSDDLGNLKVNFLIKMPKKLTDNQIELLKKVKENQ